MHPRARVALDEDGDDSNVDREVANIQIVSICEDTTTNFSIFNQAQLLFEYDYCKQRKFPIYILDQSFLESVFRIIFLQIFVP